MKTPGLLDRIADHVLAYRPKPKTKAAKRRISRLGRDLRRIADAIAASGLKPLTRAQVLKQKRDGR